MSKQISLFETRKHKSFNNLISLYLAGRGEGRGRESSLFVGQASDLVRVDVVGLGMMGRWWRMRGKRRIMRKEGGSIFKNLGSRWIC